MSPAACGESWSASCPPALAFLTLQQPEELFSVHALTALE